MTLLLHFSHSELVDLINQNMDMLAELVSLEHGKTLPDAKGDVQRGLEVIEVCMGAPAMLKGEMMDSAGPGIDSRNPPPGPATQVSRASAKSASSVAAQNTGAVGTPVSRSIASASSRAASALDQV